MKIWPFGPKVYEIEAGSNQLLELRVPSRAVIRAINFNEVGDGTTSGVFEIYDSEKAAAFEVGSASASDIDGGESEAHSITNGEVTITSGQYTANNLAIHYANRDGTATNPVRRLWMRVNLSGSGTIEFSLSMTLELLGYDG